MTAWEAKLIADDARCKNLDSIVESILYSFEEEAKKGLYSSMFGYDLPLNFDYHTLVRCLEANGYKCAIQMGKRDFVIKVMWD